MTGTGARAVAGRKILTLLLPRVGNNPSGGFILLPGDFFAKDHLLERHPRSPTTAMIAMSSKSFLLALLVLAVVCSMATAQYGFGRGGFRRGYGGYGGGIGRGFGGGIGRGFGEYGRGVGGLGRGFLG
ncbi:hypothetical protein MRX96_048308 [Rhipicephalus microplus]